jgi:hypothetical protein
MGRIVMVSLTSFSIALVAAAGLDAYTAKWPSAAQSVWLVVPERTPLPRPPRVCCGGASARNATPADPFRSPRSEALRKGVLTSTLAGGDRAPGADLPRPSGGHHDQANCG